jgi:Ca-activated chloride channel family protein
MMRLVRRGGLLSLVAALVVACASPKETDVRDASPTNQTDARDTLPKSQESARGQVEPPKQTASAEAEIKREVLAAQAGVRREEVRQKVAVLEEAIVTGNRIRGVAEDAALPVQILPASAISASISAPAAASPCCAQPMYTQRTNTERYAHFDDNPVRIAAEQPVSTFSIDVDTGAYANVRRFLNAGSLPPEDAVRVEEMINYFDYAYVPPATREQPFRVATELSAAPWNPEALLLRVGIKGFDIAADARPAANLVFLIDVSGSMQTPDKLPLLKNAFRLLTDQLTAKDRVSMVVYAGSSGVVLEPTPGDRKQTIREAIDRLEAGGSTNGAAGVTRAYQLAHAGFVKDGINRVVLATDGDFNVGIVNFEQLVDLAERERASGVALTTLGFGTGNYNDQLLERLADAGNGNYAYVDTLAEARKVLVTELSSTLFTIAKDVKIQVEFNPATVREYRLIGYQNRALAREDFNNDKVDAGEIGAGHRITALYEIIPAGGKGRIDGLRYGAASVSQGKSAELAHLRLRYKQPDSDRSQLLEYPILKNSLVAAERQSTDFRFAASVAAFGQLLRGGKYLADFGYDDVERLANGALAEDKEGYRREFLSLVKLAASLSAGKPEQVSEIAR